jgi:hypothetical protein
MKLTKRPKLLQSSGLAAFQEDSDDPVTAGQGVSAGGEPGTPGRAQLTQEEWSPEERARRLKVSCRGSCMHFPTLSQPSIQRIPSAWEETTSWATETWRLCSF